MKLSNRLPQAQEVWTGLSNRDQTMKLLPRRNWTICYYKLLLPVTGHFCSSTIHSFNISLPEHFRIMLLLAEDIWKICWERQQTKHETRFDHDSQSLVLELAWHWIVGSAPTLMTLWVCLSCNLRNALDGSFWVHCQVTKSFYMWCSLICASNTQIKCYSHVTSTFS